ncbi:hypothetical protein MBGDC06_00011 [Thermoplasmatales archaeon SCGC AB-539-C06]|nr:hypothetical protein MBGDC06_00011 [Thermoplasmatales archaeon SCGC AB-539-C06]
MNNKNSRESINEEEIENEKVNYRRANINDIEALVDYRIQFLNELYNHPEEDEIKTIKKTF